MARTWWIGLFIAVSLVVAAPASAAVEIVNRGFFPDQPVENGNIQLSIEAKVGTAPYIVEFICCDVFQTDTPTKVIDDSSPETQSTSGFHSFSFKAATANTNSDKRTVTVRVTDSNGDQATKAFTYKQPTKPTPAPTATPAPANPPPGSTEPETLSECPTVVSFGLILARQTSGGCWQKRRAQSSGYSDQGVTVDGRGVFYEGAGRFSLNGIPFPAAPSGSKYVLAEPTSSAPGGQIGLNRTVELKLSTVTIFKAPLLWKLPTGTTQGELAAFKAPAGVLGDLPIGGEIKVLFRKRAGSFATSVPITVTLPSIFKPSPGTTGAITGATEITTDDRSGVSLDGGRIEVANAAIGKVALKSLCLSYLSANVSSDFAACEPPTLNDQPGLPCGQPKDNLERFDGAVVIQLPTSSETELAAYAGVAGGRFAYGGGFGDNLAIPLVQGVTLERVGFGLCVQPSLVLKADAGFGFVKGLLRGDGSLTYREEANRNFSVEAFAAARIVTPVLTLPIGDGRIKLNSTGSVDFGLNASVLVPPGFLGFLGSLNGFVQGPVPTARVKKPFAFSVDGKISACIIFPTGPQCFASALVVVSSAGTGGCADFLGAKVGATFLWKPARNEAAFQLGAGFNCGFADRVKVKATRQAGGEVTFPVPEGSPQYVAHIQGSGAPPKVRITSPSGKVIQSSSGPTATDDELFVLLENDEVDETSVFLHADAAPGDWKVETLPGSAPVTGIEFQGADTRPNPLAGTVRRKGANRIVDVAYALGKGETLTLQVTGKDYQQSIAPNVKGERCPAGRKAPGRTRAASLCATVRWTPSFGFKGTRKVEAMIADASGQPVRSKVLGSFKQAAPKKAPAVPALRLMRKGKDVIAAWGAAGGNTERYGAYAVLSDGRRLGHTSPRDCLAWRIRGVDKRTKVQLRLQAGRQDLEFGKQRSVTLSRGERYAGPSKLKGLRLPPTCANL